MRNAIRTATITIAACLVVLWAIWPAEEVGTWLCETDAQCERIEKKFGASVYSSR